MTTDDDLAADVLAAADAGSEDLWRMPMRAHYAEPLESQVADLNNLGDMKGQTMIAATFLSRFAPEGTPYAHLDIAGPAFNPGKPYAQVPHGGTGYGVATLVNLLDA
jgi:leucyl aminopeptidase